MNKKKKNKGVLPSYWVNIEEMAQVFLDLISKKTYIDYGKQKIKGLYLDIKKNINTQEITWKVDEKLIAITGIDFLPNDYRNIGYLNSFDMYINDELYFEDIFIKEVEEYKHFHIRKPLQQNSTIKFVLKNKDNMLDNIMFNIHYIGNIKIKEYKIICKDIDTNSIIKEDSLFLVQPFEEQKICPSDIDGYIKINEDCITINNNDTIDEIIFFYKKEDLIINHDYDILCKLNWIGEIDIDLHCFINQNEVSYSNKEISLDNKNKCWLDYDYRTGEIAKPEIITILGFKNEKALIKVNYFAGITNNEIIKLEIFKKDKNKMDILLREIEFKTSILEHKIPKEICEIDLKTQKVTKLI